MLYTNREYFKLALINASYRQVNEYSQPRLKLHILSSVFKRSLVERTNLFTAADVEVRDLIAVSFPQDSYYQGRVEKAVDIFCNQQFWLGLKSR
ncbi:hypothetical protein MWH25_03475 [Natroniella acetigena]|uniref:hypothetical protein n=1 Tax=Natroniella acetigena TaxID=52004 RepID=UPI00200B8BA6|nr:hypothetical protein [Natroniella acetigena]MCK8826806.1 hypothetical protein [Natroniella acetigena]